MFSFEIPTLPEGEREILVSHDVKMSTFSRLHFDTGMLFEGLGNMSQFYQFLLLEISLLSSTFAVHPCFQVQLHLYVI